jgi:hypothetical protein
MTDSTQWNDTDSDGYGDNPAGTLPDACPTTYGESWQNGTFGCPDADEDGWADSGDSHPNDQTQWLDVDGDGYGDNPGGLNPDACVNQPGNSTQGNRMGCPDTDGDGWDDAIDALPNLDTQWLDQDGDGYGDNASGLLPDACPGEPGTSTIDRYGCVDDDGDGYSNASDAFPSDPTRWVDSDNDGYDDAEDDCPLISGTSTADRLGCLDSDGDGVSNPTLPIGNQSGWNASDGADAFPDDATQISDQDGDGYGDNATGNQPDACPIESGTSSVDRFGCADEDADGTSDANDAFLGDSSQWSDADGDGYGDNPDGSEPDACPSDSGTSTLDRFGCIDSDGDGASDAYDLWPNDNTQWFDTDGDGFGDEAIGTNGDDCPTQSGTSTQASRGCPDRDNDGWADTEDDFPDQRTQHADSDGDGYGDNASLGAYRPDHWPSDASRNSAEASMTCAPVKIELDLAASGWFSFTCTVSTTMSTAFAANVDWEATTNIVGETSNHFLTFTSSSGNSQTVTFSGTAKAMGTHQLLLSAREPGATYPMDTVMVRIITTDSNAPVEVADEAGGSLISVVADNTMVQAALAGLILFALMGMLMIRGKAKTAKDNRRRMERMSQLRTQRGITEHHPGGMVQRPQTMARARSPSMFDEFRKK